MDILPDVLKPNLKIVFCGMAAGTRSAKLRDYYAGVANRFWRIISEIDLTPYKLTSYEHYRLLNYNIGLTDLVKGESGNDYAVHPSQKDIKTLEDKIRLFTPKILAFNGKRSAEIFLGHPVDYGLQKEQIGQTRIYVLPSTSLQGMQFWDAKYWHELSEYIRQLM